MVQKENITLVGQTTPGKLNGHIHGVIVDEIGNGEAKAADGHIHEISNFHVIFNDGHTHSLIESSLVQQ